MRSLATIVLLHHCIDLLDRFREFIPYVDELLHGHNVLTSRQDQQDRQHVVGMPDQIDQVLTAGATDAGQPTAWLGDMRPSHDVVGRAGSGIDYNCPTGAPFTLNVADQVATDRTPSLNRLTP